MIARVLRRPEWLSRYAAFVLIFMVLDILEGAVVRATGSGAGCGNHWPLCNGQVIPVHPRVATVIEFGHRSLTGLISALVFSLIAWVFFAHPARSRARRAALWTLALLILEAFLGAVLVKGGYVEKNASTARVVIQGIHFTNTMLLLGAIALTWWWSRDRDEALDRLPPEARYVAWTALLASLLTGAAGSVAALADTIFPSPSLAEGLAADFAASAPLLIRMRWIHPVAAILATACAVWFARRLRTRPARWFALLMGLQLCLGLLDVLLLAPVWLQVLHLALADAIWVALIVACSQLLVPAHGTRLEFAAHPA